MNNRELECSFYGRFSRRFNSSGFSSAILLVIFLFNEAEHSWTPTHRTKGVDCPWPEESRTSVPSPPSFPMQWGVTRFRSCPASVQGLPADYPALRPFLHPATLKTTMGDRGLSIISLNCLFPFGSSRETYLKALLLGFHSQFSLDVSRFGTLHSSAITKTFQLQALERWV